MASTLEVINEKGAYQIGILNPFSQPPDDRKVWRREVFRFSYMSMGHDKDVRSSDAIVKHTVDDARAMDESFPEETCLGSNNE
jgi:hypothetical protein